MGKVYEKIKQIHIRYSEITKDPSEDNINELYRYLDEYGLINRKSPERVKYFIQGLKEELPKLNKTALYSLKNTYYNTIWALQTGDIIYPFSIIPNIDGKPWPTIAAEIISEYPLGVGSKKKAIRSSRANLKGNKKTKSKEVKKLKVKEVKEVKKLKVKEVKN